MPFTLESSVPLRFGGSSLARLLFGRLRIYSVGCLDRAIVLEAYTNILLVFLCIHVRTRDRQLCRENMALI